MIPKTLFNVARQVPETREQDWGDQVTGILDDLIDGAEAALTRDGSGNLLPKAPSASNTLASLATLTPTAAVHKIQGSGGAVTLHATTAIADGTADGQLLLLQGAHAANTVTIPAASNTNLNGPCTLGLGETLYLRWDLALSAWYEITRSN